MYRPATMIPELQPLAPISNLEISIPPIPVPPIESEKKIKQKKQSNGASKNPKGKRNRKSITLDIKLEIIKRFEKGQKVSEIMKATGLGSSTISTIITNRDKIISCTFATEPSQFSSIKIVRRRSSIMENMERLITFWMEDRSQKAMPLTISAIRHKAISLFNNLKLNYDIDSQIETFSASKGWIEKFKIRHNLGNVKLLTSAPAIDMKAAEKFPEYFQNLVRDNNLVSRQVFNVDEVELFWKRMPERTFLTQEEKGNTGFKSYKDKVTLIFVTNAEGDFKMKPLLVYHSENPRAMKRYVKSMLPVTWCSHSKGLVSSKIFEDWLTQQFFPAAENYFVKHNLENRGLLLLDFAPAHLLNFRQLCGNFLVKHIPKNTTTVMQPMDQGISSTFKAYYIKKVFQQMLNESEKDNRESIRNFWNQYNIINAVYHIADSWMEINSANINGAWRNIWPQCVYPQNTFDQILVQLNETQQTIILLAREIGFRDIVESDIIEVLNCQDDEMSDEILTYIDKERIEEDNERKKLKKNQLNEPVLRDVLKNFDKGLKILADHDPNIDRSSTITQKLNTALSFYRQLQKELVHARQTTLEDSFYDRQVVSQFKELHQKVIENIDPPQTSPIETENNEDEVWPGEEDDFVQQDNNYYDPPSAPTSADEFDAFSKSIATQLRQLPQEIALELMAEIQQMIVQKRLEVIAKEKKIKSEQSVIHSNRTQIQTPHGHEYLRYLNDNMYLN